MNLELIKTLKRKTLEDLVMAQFKLINALEYNHGVNGLDLLSKSEIEKMKRDGILDDDFEYIDLVKNKDYTCTKDDTYCHLFRLLQSAGYYNAISISSFDIKRKRVEFNRTEWEVKFISISQP